MFAAMNVSDAFREYLTDLEAEIDRPIRLLNGRARTYAPTLWTAVHTRGTPWLAREGNERGITIVTASTTAVPLRLHSPRLHDDDGEWMVPPYEGGYVLYDSCRLSEDDAEFPTVEFPNVRDGDDAAVLAVGDRVVLCGYAYLSEMFDAYKPEHRETLFAGPIRTSFDEGRRETLLAAAEKAQHDRFLAYVKSTTRDGAAEIIQEIGDMSTLLADATTNVARYKEEMRQKQRQLDYILAADADSPADRAVRDWALIKAHPKVESLKLIGDQRDPGMPVRIELTTVPLDITHPTTGYTAYLGRFRWLIEINSTIIEAHNLDNAKGGFDHPHVYMNRPCFGNMGETVHRLIKQGELMGAVEMIFAFLGTINLEDDWSRRASYWLGDGTGTEVEEHEPLTDDEVMALAGVN